jgi:hypothetical protein
LAFSGKLFNIGKNKDMNTLRQKIEARIAQSRDPYSNGNVSLAKAYHAGEVATLEWVLSLLEQEQQEEWISVEDRLPKPLTDVLVLAGNFGVEQASYYNFKDEHRWFTTCKYQNNLTGYVTHWQPLPEASK